MVTESATQNLQPSFISAVLDYRANVMVSQPASVRAAYNARSGQTPLSVDRAGEEHLYIAQLERNQYVAHLSGPSNSLCGTHIGTAINTYITLAARARNDFVLRTAGLPLRTIFSGYLLKETCLVCLCSAAGVGTSSGAGAEYAFSAMAAPLLYGTILALVLRLSFNRSLHRDGSPSSRIGGMMRNTVYPSGNVEHPEVTIASRDIVVYAQGSPFSRVPTLRHSGEVTGIVGPSGCGKTTLLNVLGLLMPPPEGEVVIGAGIWNVLARRSVLRSGLMKPSFSGLRNY